MKQRRFFKKRPKKGEVEQVLRLFSCVDESKINKFIEDVNIMNVIFTSEMDILQGKDKKQEEEY